MSGEAQIRASVGTSVPRVDGPAKVTGQAIYVDDVALEGALHGATVRSPVPHGILRAIELDPTYDFSEVVVATAADVPGKNTIFLMEEDQPALVPIGGTIMHPDEPVALVAAKSRFLAHEAAAHIKLVIDPLPAVLSIEEALDAKIKLYGEDNVFKRFQILKGGDVEAALAGAAYVVESVYRTGAQEQMYIEPQGMIAHWDEEGRCRLLGSMQCPYYVHKAMKVFLGCGEDDVSVAQTVTGGGFGGKEEYPSMLAAHVAMLAKKAGRPVKMIYDRDEDIAATTKRHPSRVHHRMGLDKEGNIVAIDVDVVFDGGAYLTLSPVVLSRGVLHAAGPYKCPNTRIVGRCVATNTPPHGAYRGFGAPQTTFAYERQTDKAARAVGMDPVAFRDKNMLRLGDSTATSQVLDYSVASQACLDAVRKVAGELPASDGVSRFGSPTKRGRGWALYYHGAGFTGSGEARLAGKAELAVCDDGKIEVRASSTDIGQGAQTMFSQIAATALGIDPRFIRVATPDTANVPDSGPTVASRTCMVVGSVVAQAATKLRERIEAWAAENGHAGTPLEILAQTMVGETGEFAELVQYSPPPGIVWDDATYTGSAYPVYGWAACLIDVSVDLDTYEVTIDRCVHAVDVGKAINPIIVKGQIEGGTLQALGWAVLEKVHYRNGRVANANMTNCIVPTFADAPELETILVEDPYPYGPHGAKGVGEIPMDGPAAAVANALENALGVAVDEVPVMPEDLARLIHESRGGRRGPADVTPAAATKGSAQ